MKLRVRKLWSHFLTAGLLIAAIVIAAVAGRLIDAAITGVLTLLPLGFLAFCFVARRKGLITDEG